MPVGSFSNVINRLLLLWMALPKLTAAALEFAATPVELPGSDPWKTVTPAESGKTNSSSSATAHVALILLIRLASETL